MLITMTKEKVITIAHKLNLYLSYETTALLLYEFKDIEKVSEMTCLEISTCRTYYYKAKRMCEWNKIIDEYEKEKFFYDFQVDDSKFYAYLMTCKNRIKDYDNGHSLKVGYSKRPLQRVFECEKNKTFYQHELVYLWEFDNCEDAYEMEIWLHRYYKKKEFCLVGQDHFEGGIIEKEDIRILTLKAEEIKINSKKWLDKIS